MNDPADANGIEMKSDLAQRLNLGQHVFGLTTLAFGPITLIWHEYTSEWQFPLYGAFTVAAIQLFGGAAVQFRRTEKAGALIVTLLYLTFAVLCVPQIVASPLKYNPWGNFFEQFSLACGAAIVIFSSATAMTTARTARLGRILLGICVASFTLEQAFYLNATSGFVPKWIPPGPMFWAIATTVFFALGALALLANRFTLLAARLLTVMIALFGLLVWIPSLVSDPHNGTSWGETVETFAIAGAIWILADLLDRQSVTSARSALA